MTLRSFSFAAVIALSVLSTVTLSVFPAERAAAQAARLDARAG